MNRQLGNLLHRSTTILRSSPFKFKTVPPSSLKNHHNNIKPVTPSLLFKSHQQNYLFKNTTTYVNNIFSINNSNDGLLVNKRRYCVQSDDEYMKSLEPILRQVGDLVMMGQIDDALAITRRFKPTDPYYPDLMMMQSNIYKEHLKDPLKAIECLDTACDAIYQNRDNIMEGHYLEFLAPFKLSKAHCFIDVGEYQAAVKLYLEVISEIELPAEHYRVIYSVMSALNISKKEELQFVLKTFDSVHPTALHPMEHLYYGMNEYDLGNHEEALKRINIGLAGLGSPSEYKDLPNVEEIRQALIAKTHLIRPTASDQEKVELLKSIFELRAEFSTAFEISGFLVFLNQYEEALKYVAEAEKLKNNLNDYFNKDTEERKSQYLIGLLMTKFKAMVGLRKPNEEINQLLKDVETIVTERDIGSFYTLVNTFYVQAIDYFLQSITIDQSEWNQIYESFSYDDKQLFKSYLSQTEISRIDNISTLIHKWLHLINTNIKNNSNNYNSHKIEYLNQLNCIFSTIDKMVSLFKSNPIESADEIGSNFIHNYNYVLKTIYRGKNIMPIYSLQSPFTLFQWEPEKLPVNGKELLNGITCNIIYDHNANIEEALSSAISSLGSNSSIGKALNTYYIIKKSISSGEYINPHVISDEYNKSIDKFEDDYERLVCLSFKAYLQLATHMFRDTLATTESILKESPDFIPAKLIHAIGLTLMREYQLAEADLLSIINNEKSSEYKEYKDMVITAFHKLGGIQLEYGNIDRAWEYFNQIYKRGLLDITSNHSLNFFTIRGIQDCNLLWLKSQVTEYIQLKPDLISSRYSLALINYSLGNFKEALADFKYIVNISSTAPENVKVLVDNAKTMGDLIEKGESIPWDHIVVMVRAYTVLKEYYGNTPMKDETLYNYFDQHLDLLKNAQSVDDIKLYFNKIKIITK